MRWLTYNGLKFKKQRALSGVLIVVFFSIAAGGTGYPCTEFHPVGDPAGYPTGDQGGLIENASARWHLSFPLYILYLMEDIEGCKQPGVIRKISDEGMRIICQLRGMVEEPVDDGILLELPLQEKPLDSSYRPGSLMFIEDPAIPCTKRVKISTVAFEPLREMVAFVNSHPGCQLMVAS